MAKPTLTAIEPSSSHPGGKELVTITGSNFELAPSPPATGYVGGHWQESMEVFIDGEKASDVRVFTTSMLTCLVPPYRKEPNLLTNDPGLSVDVKLRNLTGPEEDTFPDAFAYKRPDFTRLKGVFSFFVRSIIRAFRRQVLDNTVSSTAVDFDADTGDGLDIVELAKAPAVVLFGPSVRENTFLREKKRRATQTLATLEYTKQRLPLVADLLFDVSIVAETLNEGLNITQEIIEFFNRNKKLEVQQNTEDASAGYVEFDLFLTTQPTRSGEVNNDSLLSWTASFEVRGVVIDSDSPTVVEWGTMTDDPADIEIQIEEI